MYKVFLTDPAARKCAAQALNAARDSRLTRSDVLGNAAHIARVCAETERLAGNWKMRAAYRAAVSAIESKFN